MFTVLDYYFTAIVNLLYVANLYLFKDIINTICVIHICYINVYLSLQQLSNFTKTYVEVTICTWMYSIYWLIAANIYYIVLSVALLLMTCHNSNIIAYFRKEGELASLIIGFIFFVFSVYQTCIVIINGTSDTIAETETVTKAIVSIIAIIVIFVLAVLYLPKVSEC